MIYSLLPNKKGTTYNALSSDLKESCGDLSGMRIILDFECASIIAF